MDPGNGAGSWRRRRRSSLRPLTALPCIKGFSCCAEREATRPRGLSMAPAMPWLGPNRAVEDERRKSGSRGTEPKAVVELLGYRPPDNRDLEILRRFGQCEEDPLSLFGGELRLRVSCT